MAFGYAPRDFPNGACSHPKGIDALSIPLETPPLEAALPPPAARTNPLTPPVLLPLLLLFTTRTLFWINNPYAGEDAYITFRYSRNLVRGLGPVYNAGERVQGFTSPVWMAWNALGILLVKGSGPVVARHHGRARGFGAGRGRAHAPAPRGDDGGLGVRHLYSSWTFFAATAVSGLESSALFATLALTAWAIERRGKAAGPLLGVVALFRPEGVVLSVVASLWARGRDRAVAAAIALLGYGALWAWYGSPLPQSLRAKAAVYGTPGIWSGRHWWEWISPLPLGRWPVTTEGSVLFAMALIGAPALVAGIVVLARDKDARGLAALGFSTLSVWLGYALVGVAYFAWYLVLPLGALATFAAVGLPRVTRGPWVALSIGLFVLGTWTFMPSLYYIRARAEYSSFALVARELGFKAKAGQSVFLEPIGMVGWANNLRIIDEIGLVSPAVAARRKQGDGWMTDVIRSEHPDWLVLRRAIAEGANGGASFAGVGRPFRSDAERAATLAPYHRLATVNEAAGPEAMEILGLDLPAKAPAGP
jgi:hypothetical protein